MRYGTARTRTAALTAFTAGVAIASAVFTWLVFTTDPWVALGSAVVAAGLLVATWLLLVNAWTAGPAAMLAGLLTVLFGVVELAFVGLWYETAGGASQPAWLHELFFVGAGAVIGAIGTRLAMLTAVRRPRTPRAQPLVGHPA